MSGTGKRGRLGFALCGSYCTFAQVFPVLEELAAQWDVTPIFSERAAVTDTRFGNASTFLERAERATGSRPILTIREAEPIGPKKLLDILVIAPCTGNTLAKLAAGITDTAVTMAAKSHLRNDAPVVIGVSTNDALGGAAKNIGQLLNYKHFYFVPFGMDNCYMKPKSMVCDFARVPQAIELAAQGQQIAEKIF